MNSTTTLFQKISLFSAKASFAISVLCGIALYLKYDELGYRSPLMASLLGSIFFFLFVGVLLTIVGKSNIPSFKLDPDE
ncbi:MAG: hypothetical protein OEL79_10080 [Chromatiales bacterium]|nr:hypothetical protein [Chromatiales bacterium]